MVNVPTAKIVRFKGIFWFIGAGEKGPSLLLVEDEGGKSAYWPFYYSLTHSKEIANFDQFSADIEAGKIRLNDDERKLYESARRTKRSKPNRASRKSFSTS